MTTMMAMTDRQRQVYELLLKGHTNREIADELGIAEGTVKVHVRLVYQKNYVRSRTQLLAKHTQME